MDEDDLYVLQDKRIDTFDKIFQAVIEKAKMSAIKACNRVYCSFCTYVTCSKSYLQNHLQGVHGHKICPFCDYSSKASDILDHLKSVHAYESLSMSDILKQSMATTDSLRIIKRNRNPIVCRVCHLTYSSVSVYRSHFIRSHPEYNPDEMYDDGWKCSQCFKVFKSLKSLQVHWVQQHKELYNKQMFIDFANEAIYEMQNELDSCMTNEHVDSPQICNEEMRVNNFCSICHVQYCDARQLLLHQSLAHFDCTEHISHVNID